MTYWVEVLVPLAGDNPPGDRRMLVPRTAHHTLYAVKSWLGAHRHAMRSWLRSGEPYFEAYVYGSDGKAVRYERCLASTFGGPDEVLSRSQLREMRRYARAAKRAEAARRTLARAPAAAGSLNGDGMHASKAAHDHHLNGSGRQRLGEGVEA